jgi:hypothetical protein
MTEVLLAATVLLLASARIEAQQTDEPFAFALFAPQSGSRDSAFCTDQTCQ